MKMIKTLLILLLCFLLAVSTMLTAYSDTIYNYGSWSFTLNTSGDFEVYSCTLDAAILSVPSQVDWYRVTAVGAGAFRENNSVSVVEMKAPLTTIREYAFMSCTALTNVTLPDTVTAIERAAFCGDTALSSVNLQDTQITSVSENCFFGTVLSQISLPITCEAIESGAFAQCPQLTAVMIPDHVTAISDDAFALSPAVTIYCTKDSYAAAYAEAHSLPYILTDVPRYLRGDADGDGELNIADAAFSQRVVTGMIPDPDGRIAQRGDVNQDGELQIDDVTWLQRYHTGIKIIWRVNEWAYYTM